MTHAFSANQYRSLPLLDDNTDDSYFFSHPVLSFLLGAFVLPCMMLLTVFTATTAVLLPIGLLMGWL